MRLQHTLLQASNYSVGLGYELLVVDTLQRYSFQLKHIGGSGDKGQDFIGYWTLPNKRIAVVGQCKCYQKPVGPSDVREFEAVLHRKFPSQLLWPNVNTAYTLPSSNIIGIMASQSWFSVSALRTFHSSKVAMMVCQVLRSSDHSPYSCESVEKATEKKQNDGASGVHCSGHLNELVLNGAAQKLLGNVLVRWKHHSVNKKELTFVVT